MVVNVADDHLRDRLLFIGHVGKAHLLQEMLLQGGARHQGIEHELPPLLRFRPLARGQIGLGEMVAPFLVHLRQPLELRLKIVHGSVARLFGGRIKFHIGRRLGQVGRGNRFPVRLVVLDLLIHLHFRRRHFLQQGVLLQLLLDQRLQFQRRRLQAAPATAAIAAPALAKATCAVTNVVPETLHVCYRHFAISQERILKNRKRLPDAATPSKVSLWRYN